MPSIQLILNITIGESLLDESQCATSAVKVQSQKSLNMRDNSSAIFTGISNLKNIDVVSKPSLPEIMGLIKNDTCSMSGQAVYLSKPKEGEHTFKTTSKEPVPTVEQSENSIKMNPYN